MWVATACGTGYGPVAPGTWGSAAALPLVALLFFLPPLAYLIALIALLLLGIWAAGAAERLLGRKDDGRIVIDEVVGQLITLTPILLLQERSVGFAAWSLLAVTGFVVFRVFDIWKPGPVRWAEQNFSGGAGVMLDDVVAGLVGVPVMALVIWGAITMGGFS